MTVAELLQSSATAVARAQDMPVFRAQAALAPTLALLGNALAVMQILGVERGLRWETVDLAQAVGAGLAETLRRELVALGVPPQDDPYRRYADVSVVG